MSAIKGVFVLAGAAVALYVGIRVIDTYTVKKHNKQVMASEQVVQEILEQEFTHMTLSQRQEFMSLKIVVEAIGEYQQGARTVESLKSKLAFVRRNYI